MSKSNIEWTEDTWNPTVGCDKVSAGCKECYAMKMAWRLMHIGHSAEKYAGTVKKTEGGQLNWTGKVNVDYPSLVIPVNNNKPTIYFLDSMSDLFHKEIPFEFIDEVFEVIYNTPQHTYQILTKRPELALQYFRSSMERANRYSYMRNVWLGVSVEDQQNADIRVPLLLKMPAHTRFLSCEPLLGPIDFTGLLPSATTQYQCSGCGHYANYYQNTCPMCGDQGYYSGSFPKINQIIVGGESGSKKARPMHPDWARDIMEQCRLYNVSFFFKQWGEWAPVKMDAGIKGTIVIDIKGAQHPLQDVYDAIQRGRCMAPVGKKKGGRELFGKVYNEMPLI
jgi:protein gp37